MLIIIKEPPYQTENPLGALFIALATADHGVPVHVVFSGPGSFCLFRDQNRNQTIQMPIISDIILSLVGTVKYYFISNAFFNETRANTESNSVNTKPIINGIKQITFDDLAELIIEQGQQLLVL